MEKVFESAPRFCGIGEDGGNVHVVDLVFNDRGDFCLFRAIRSNGVDLAMIDTTFAFESLDEAKAHAAQYRL